MLQILLFVFVYIARRVITRLWLFFFFVSCKSKYRTFALWVIMKCTWHCDRLGSHKLCRRKYFFVVASKRRYDRRKYDTSSRVTNRNWTGDNTKIANDAKKITTSESQSRSRSHTHTYTLCCWISEKRYELISQYISKFLTIYWALFFFINNK